MSGLLRVLIADDEPPARDRIREVLDGVPDVEIAGEAGDGAAAARAIVDLRPDVVFLDVCMPEADGFSVLAALPEGSLPLVVFVTAFDAYAARAFDVHAVDYVLKPFDSERLRAAVGRARERLRTSSIDERERQLQALVDALAVRQPPLERMLVRHSGRFEFVRTADVDWIEAAGNYAMLHVAGKTRLLRQTLGGLERQLDRARFRRVHRSSIVNLDRVAQVRPSPGDEYEAVLRDGTVLRVSRSYRRNLLGEDTGV